MMHYGFKRRRGILFWLFILAIASDPIIAILYNIYLEKSWGLEVSFFQLTKGIFLLPLLIITLKNVSAFRTVRLLWPLLMLFFYSFTMFLILPIPDSWADLVWSLRVLYIIMIFLAAYLLTINNIIQLDTLWKLAAFVVMAFLATQVIAIYAGYGGINAYGTDYGSLGFVSYAKTVPWAICMSIPCFFMSRHWRSKDVLMILISLVAVLLTLRRTVLLAFLLGFIIIGMIRFFRARMFSLYQIATLAVLSIIVVALSYVFSETELGYAFIQRINDLDPSQGTASGRYIFQKVALNYLLERGYIATLFGEGAGYPIIVLGERLQWFIQAHSDWLNIAIAYGVVGITFFIFLFVGILRMIISAKNKSSEILDMLIILIVIMFVCSIASGGLLESSFALPYAALGMAAAYLRNNFQTEIQDFVRIENNASAN